MISRLRLLARVVLALLTGIPGMAMVTGTVITMVRKPGHLGAVQASVAVVCFLSLVGIAVFTLLHRRRQAAVLFPVVMAWPLFGRGDVMACLAWFAANLVLLAAVWWATAPDPMPAT